MKKILLPVLSLIAFILVVIFAASPLFTPCDYAFQYKVGFVDPRFKITSGEFMQDIATAGDIWSKPENKKLFEYNPKATFTINLIFDERQQLNNQVTNLNSEVNSEKDTIDPQIQEYQDRVSSFNKRLADLNSQIQYWNNKGGAPSNEYDKLVSEQESLSKEAKDLNAMAKRLNQSTSAYNTQVNLLNKTINAYDQTVQAKPEEGLYQPDQDKIDIYYNNGHTELIHTLTHELGHAIGFNHTPDPNSIMYYQTNKTTLPTKDDLDQLASICERKSAYELVSERLAYVINLYTHSNNQNPSK